MALDDVDSALEDYQPTDTEDDVQDESVRMQNAPSFDTPVNQSVDTETPGENVEGGKRGISRDDSRELGNTSTDFMSGAVGAMRPQELGNPNPMQAANSALAAGNATASAQGQVGAAQAEHQQFLAGEAGDREVQSRLDEIDRQDQAKAQHAALEKTHQETEAAAKKFDEFKFHDHWKEAPVANKVLAVLFSGIGGAAAARTGGQNEALRAMDDISQREYQKDVQNLNKAETFYKWKKEGETDLQGRFEKEKAGLQMQQSARLKQMADMAESHYLRTHPGATVDEAKNNQITAGLTQKAAETYSSAVQNIYKIEAAKQAALLRAKKTGSGGGNQTGLSTLIKMREEGQPDSAIAAKAAELRIAPKVWLPAVKDVSARTGAAAREGNAEKKLTTEEEKRIVRDSAGNEVGLAANPRMIDKTQQRMVNYDDAEKSLQELLAYHKTDPWKAKLPVGDRYDRAVLAVATVTTANASDKTTTHEANTIKNYGLSSPEAIERTLRHVQERKQAFVKQLQPLKEDKGEPAKSEKSAPTVIESRVVKGVKWNKMSDGTFVKDGG